MTADYITLKVLSIPKWNGSILAYQYTSFLYSIIITLCV